MDYPTLEVFASHVQNRLKRHRKLLVALFAAPGRTPGQALAWAEEFVGLVDAQEKERLAKIKAEGEAS